MPKPFYKPKEELKKDKIITCVCPLCGTSNKNPLVFHFKKLHSEKDLEKAILNEKIKGISDEEIGDKYGVTFRYIEEVIRKLKGVAVSRFNTSKKLKPLYPKDFREERTTVWSFRQRGNWATHTGEYRGNWSPYIPRNVILKYSKPGELVLDYFCGAGTTAVEAKLLGRKCIALDINDKAIELAKRNINFKLNEKLLKSYEPELFVGDARNLSFLESNSVDLICAHPPYADTIQYTDNKKGDLSFLQRKEFLKQMVIVAKESYRVLKPGRQCAILIGDMRKRKFVVPLGFELMNVYLDAGFKLKELVIKRQWNCKTTGFWYKNSIKYNFLLLAHEYLPIFEKPKPKIITPLIKEELAPQGAIQLSCETLLLKKRLKELESTTVWIFPEENFQNQLNKNIIRRYSKHNKYEIISFRLNPDTGKKISFEKKRKPIDLFFIKSPCLEESYLDVDKINSYLSGIKKTVDKEVDSIINRGFCVIQTRDVRINGYIEPLAKKIVDILPKNRLRLKEIVVVSSEKQNKGMQYANNNQLEITHQYLLIYQKIE